MPEAKSHTLATTLSNSLNNLNLNIWKGGSRKRVRITQSKQVTTKEHLSRYQRLGPADKGRIGPSFI